MTPKRPARKRFSISLILGLVFGLLCITFASTKRPGMWDLGNPGFWLILTDRLLIGYMIGFAGAYVRHPIFGFRCFPWLRGPVLGALVSLPMAFAAFFMTPLPDMSNVTIFWSSLIMGAVFGLIIDLVATKWGGEGKRLVEE